VRTGRGHRSRRGLAAPGLALAAWLVALLPAKAAADVWTEDVPDSLHRYSLESISFEGDYGDNQDELRKVIRSSTSGLLRFRPVDLERVDGDVYRLRSFFRRGGYWNATVDRRIEFETARRKTRVTFVIDRGVQRVVGQIGVRGNQSFPPEEILSNTKQKAGDPFDYNQTARDRTAIENSYANQGFFEVQVTADIQPAAAPTDSGPSPPDSAGPKPIVHDLIFRVVEGTRYSVGEIRIEGHEITKDDIILRELTFGPGDVLNREELSQSRSHLYATGYFSRVELVPQVKDAEEGHVDLVIRVSERKMRFVNGGLGYGTRDQLRTSGSWGHRNLWGRGKRAEINAIVATEIVPRVDLVRTTVTGRYVEPWLLGTRTTGTAELTFERSREFSTVEAERVEYDLNRTSLILSANRQLARYTKGWLGVESEWANVDAGERESELAELELTPEVTRTVGTQIDHDRRDHLFNPENGFVHRFIGSVSGGPLGGDNDYWKTQLESGWFRSFPLGVVAGRIRVGYERPFGPSEIVPDRDRFKLGGESTVRGYKEQAIGPGDFMLLGNIEARIPLFWKFETAAFLDGGNAWNRASDVTWEDFRLTESKDDPVRAAETEVRYSWGFGLRLRTPVGPVRLDWGRKFKILPPLEGRGPEEKSMLHLSLGHVF
jgi:outer membrane protein assembly complex protein YaeT